jgi:hypothetical protein
MDNLPQKFFLVFWAYFIRFGKRNNFVKEFFQFEPFFVEKTQFENTIFVQQHYTFRLISSQKTGKTVIFKFSNRVFSAKKGSNGKKFFYKVVSFCDTNKISPKKRSSYFEASYPFC